MGFLRSLIEGVGYFRGGLGLKISLFVGSSAFLLIAISAYLYLNNHRATTIDQIQRDSFILSESIKSTILHGPEGFDPETIQERMKYIQQGEGILYVHVLDHKGNLRVSTRDVQIGVKVDMKDVRCIVCHSRERPSESFPHRAMFRKVSSETGTKVLQTLNPIYNEKRCYSAPCHIHPREKKVLGFVEVGRSMEVEDVKFQALVWKTILLSAVVFFLILLTVSFSITVFVNRPVNELLYSMRKLTMGEYPMKLKQRKDEVGELIEAFGDMAREISIRTQELEQSRKQYKELFERVPCYIAVLDNEYRIVQANGSFTETFGNRIGAHCYEAYKGRREKCKNCSAEKTFRDGMIHMSEEVGLNKERRETNYIVYTAPILNDEGRVSHVIEMSVDITLTKELERQLKVSQEFQENLIKNSLVAIVATDREGKVVIFNRAAGDLLKYDHSEVIGSHDLEMVFPKEFCSKIIRSLDGKETEETGRLIDHETLIRAKDGEMIPVRFSGVILFEGNVAIGSVGFFMDLRRIKALEREKLQAERLAIVGQTVAGLAHSVKNILTGLEGGVFVVNTGFRRRDDALVRKGWEMLGRNIQKISTLVQDLLSYSKQRTPQYEKVDPNELMADIFRLFEEKAKREGIIIETVLQEGMDDVFLDPKGIHTCLVNLVSNAIDACKMKLNHTEGKVILKTRKEKGWAVIFEVSDNGIGMDEETKAKIFQSFFSTKGTSGTGLGLLVTHKIVLEHNGEITFDSRSGEGSTFTIKLPEISKEPEGECI